MNRTIKMFLWVLFLSFSSVVVAEQTATSFIYPVGSPNIAPTEVRSANGFSISQYFNTSANYEGGGASGGWCARYSDLTPQSSYITKQTCEANAGFKWIYGHTGVDLSNGDINCMTTSNPFPIKATANGVVIFSGSYPGYGNLLKIRHTLPNGRIVYSLYGHRRSVMMNVGDTVVLGQTVGYVGNTGAGSNCHLHFAIFDQSMPLNSADAPVGYVYSDKNEKTYSGTLIPSNIMRYFYDPLLFVNDRNNDWSSSMGNAGYWYLLNASFDRSIPTRTAYVVNSAGVAKSLQSAADAGWMNSRLWWIVGTTWYYYNQPIESNTLYSNISSYVVQTYLPNLTFHVFPPGNNYLDARWRGDMAEFTTVNSVFGYGRALRETYNNNPNWDVNYGLVSMTYEQPVDGYTYGWVYLSYSKTDPLVRYVMGYNSQTHSWTSWIRVY